MELKVSNVRKMYNKTVAVKNANLYLERGIYGLLGANGAGKTTLMSMISSLEIPDSGCITYNGKNIFAMGDEYRVLTSSRS